MSISEEAKVVYELEFGDRLESTHRDKFVAIEPTSKAFFSGDTFIAAALAAKEAFPGQNSFVLRIGHDAAFQIGGATGEDGLPVAFLLSNITTNAHPMSTH